MLDFCGTTRDILLLVKGHLQDLGHIFRRARPKINNGLDFEAQILAHVLYRKKLKKEVGKCLRAIKTMKDKYFITDLSQVDQNLIVVAHVLREVRGVTVSTLESLLNLISLPTTISITHNQTSFASKFIPIVRCQRLLERCDSMEIQMANKLLEEVESAMEVLEVELECIIRHLIHTRVLLLNILDYYWRLHLIHTRVLLLNILDYYWRSISNSILLNLDNVQLVNWYEMNSHIPSIISSIWWHYIVHSSSF